MPWCHRFFDVAFGVIGPKDERLVAVPELLGRRALGERAERRELAAAGAGAGAPSPLGRRLLRVGVRSQPAAAARRRAAVAPRRRPVRLGRGRARAARRRVAEPADERLVGGDGDAVERGVRRRRVDALVADPHVARVDAARVDKPLLEPLPLAPLERRRLEPRRRRGARGVAAREEALLLDDARAEAHVVPRVEPVHPHAAVGVEVAVELEAVLVARRDDVRAPRAPSARGTRRRPTGRTAARRCGAATARCRAGSRRPPAPARRAPRAPRTLSCSSARTTPSARGGRRATSRRRVAAAARLRRPRSCCGGPPRSCCGAARASASAAESGSEREKSEGLSAS